MLSSLIPWRRIPATAWLAISFVAMLGWWTCASWEFNIKRNVLRADASGYYIYSPGLFQHGFRAKGIDTTIIEKAGHGFHLDASRDRIITKYTCGPALLEAPFYLIADLVTGWGTTDGFTRIHHRAIQMAGVFYWLSGLLLLGLALNRWIPSRWWVAGVTLAVISFGSNVFFYAFRMPGFAHIYSFFTACAAIWGLNTCTTQPSFRWRLHVFHLASALLVLIRPVDIILVIGLHAWLFMRDPALYRSSGNWAGQLLAAALVMFPQLLYWHFVHGSWVVYSYGDEGFTQWRTPHVVEFLFAVQNGCLPYAPALLLLPWSIPALWRVDKRVAIMCLLVLVVIVYGCASWYTWQYGCSYGARPMVQYMPLIAIPIWSFLARTDHRSFHWRLAILPVMALLCFLNYRAMLQYGECIDGDEIWNWRIYLENIMNAFL